MKKNISKKPAVKKPDAAQLVISLGNVLCDEFAALKKSLTLIGDILETGHNLLETGHMEARALRRTLIGDELEGDPTPPSTIEALGLLRRAMYFVPIGSVLHGEVCETLYAANWPEKSISPEEHADSVPGGLASHGPEKTPEP